jgi:hypothetical protein
MDNGNSGIADTTLNPIKDGDGNEASLRISQRGVQIVPSVNGIKTMQVNNASGSAILQVDATNGVVKVNAGQAIANTQYAHFGQSSLVTNSFAAGTHYMIPFRGQIQANSSNPISLGTGTDPATTFTTAEGNATRASALVPMLWYIPDSITIDEIKHFTGADTATGDTTRMHLMSYRFTSGYSACLDQHVLQATSPDLLNAGSEQPYLTDWTIATADVDGGRVLVCSFEQDGTNSDYSVSVTIKYHLR